MDTPSPKFTATAVITGGTTPRVLVLVPQLPRLASMGQRRQREAFIAATAHQVAAQIVLLHADRGLSMSFPHVEHHRGTVTVEGVTEAQQHLVEQLLVDACQRAGLPMRAQR